MATYTYECERCGEIEVEQKIGDPALTKCPKRVPYVENGILFQPVCDRPVKRLISSGTNFTLKGSGWAKDGYK